MSKTALFSRSSSKALCVATVALLMAGPGCQAIKHLLGIRSESLGADGGVDLSIADLAGVTITFSVTPNSQTVSMHPDYGAPFYPDRSFCTSNTIPLTGTLTNVSGSSLYVSAIGLGNIGVSYFKYNGSPLTPTTTYPNFHVAPMDKDTEASHLLGAGEHISFPIGICPLDPTNNHENDYAYSGTGAYTVQFFYQYQGPDLPVNYQEGWDAGPDFDGGVSASTFKETVYSAEVTINVD